MTSPTERCMSCRWWDGFGDHGYCHRLPPIPVYDAAPDQDSGLQTAHPCTAPIDWCGEWLGLRRGSEQ